MQNVRESLTLHSSQDEIVINPTAVSLELPLPDSATKRSRSGSRTKAKSPTYRPIIHWYGLLYLLAVNACIALMLSTQPMKSQPLQRATPAVIEPLSAATQPIASRIITYRNDAD